MIRPPSGPALTPGVPSVETRAKHARLEDWFRRAGSVAVAYSGGADSALVLKVAHDVLGERSVGVTAVSASLARAEREEAAATAAAIGARHLWIESHEVEDPRYRENTSTRCYYCKSDVYARILAFAEREGFAAVVDGTNVDDLSDQRPGRIAARERGVRSPLAETGLTKQEVRLLSRALGLPTWDKPAAACLSSRVPHGTGVTSELLGRIERGEDLLRAIGLRQFRLRHHDAIARIEVEPADLALVLAHRESLAAALKGLGYAFVTLDLEGFRSGSLNAANHDPAGPMLLGGGGVAYGERS